MHTLTVSEARSHFHRLMDQTAKAHQPIYIVGRRTRAVLLSGEDWDTIQETLFLLSTP